MNKLFSILFAMVFIGCAASVSTEQYVGEYENIFIKKLFKDR